MEERFGYDEMNRLTGVWLGSAQTGASAYDGYGRMTSKTAGGQPVFSNAVFNTTAKPHALDAATTAEGVFLAAPQAVTYTGFDKVGKVKQGSDSLCYAYGYDRQRILMEEHVGGLTRTKRYVGNCEFVTESDGTTTAEYCLTYLTGPTGVYSVVVKGSDGDAVHYILKDNLGSWTTITNANGTVEQRLSFDAWGNLRDPNTWSGSFTGAPMFDRGFTGHEHLYNFGLINMNGRMYDPVMSVFLSVDQCVQSSENAQGFNRYAYCMFNPLKYTDPTGWLAGGGHTGYTPNSSANAFDPYAFYGGHIPLEPRDLGLRELSTADPIITWMEENSLHGSGNGPKGGWYLYGNEIHWSPEVSSQDDLKKLGMEEGFFIGHSFTDELNHTYYSLLGYVVDIKESGGLAGEIFPLIDIALCKYENDKSSKNKDFFDPTIAEPSTTNFGVIKYVLGSDNIYSFATNNFMVYLQVFDGSSGKRENSMNAAFRGLSDSYVFNPNNHYGLSSHTSFVPGYDLYFNNPYANPKCWRVMIVFPTIPVRNNFIDRYNNVFGYGNY
jgi:RHS repeat-associated protein